jgi:uncharacterized protein
MSRLIHTTVVLLFVALTTLVRAAIPSDALLERLQPQPGRFVNDFARVLNDSQRDALEQRVRALQQKTDAELAVVTLPSLEGGQIDDFTNRLFRRWGVGQKGKNNGVMLLIAIHERKMRIEVGYGLEPILTDAMAGRIIDGELRPQFRQNNFPEGLRRGVERIAVIIERGEPASRSQLTFNGFRRDEIPLQMQLFFTALFCVFVTIGLFMMGNSIGAKQGCLLVFFVPFGAGPMLMAFFFVPFALFVLVPLAVLMFWLGLRRGRSHPNEYGGYRRRVRGGGWEWVSSGDNWNSGGFSDSGGGGGFGGGDSGGGGASGGW